MADPTARERAERILSSEEVLDTFSGCTISREKVEREILAAERAAAREAVTQFITEALGGTKIEYALAALAETWLRAREEGRRG